MATGNQKKEEKNKKTKKEENSKKKEKGKGLFGLLLSKKKEIPSNEKENILKANKEKKLKKTAPKKAVQKEEKNLTKKESKNIGKTKAAKTKLRSADTKKTVAKPLSKKSEDKAKKTIKKEKSKKDIKNKEAIKIIKEKEVKKTEQKKKALKTAEDIKKTKKSQKEKLNKSKDLLKTKKKENKSLKEIEKKADEGIKKQKQNELENKKKNAVETEEEKSKKNESITTGKDEAKKQKAKVAAAAKQKAIKRIKKGKYDNFEKSKVNPFYTNAAQKKLLTKEQEEFHAKQIEEWKSLLQKKQKKNKSINVSKELRSGALGESTLSEIKFTKKEQEIVIKGKFSRDEMILSNLRLVISNAKKFATKNLTFDDLVQHGTIGLFRAIDKFDWRKGFKFSTYATYWIWQAIGRAIADHDRIIRLPVHIKEFASKYNKAINALAEEHGVQPTEKDIAEYLGVTVQKVREIKAISQDPISADNQIGDEGNTTIAEITPDNNEEDSEDKILRSKKTKALKEIISQLRPKERYLFIARNGLMKNGTKQTFEEIGGYLGMTRQRVEQIEKEVMKKIKVLAYKKGLSEVLSMDSD